MDDFFSDDYFIARRRFRGAAVACGARCSSYSIDADHDLTIDVAILGDDQRAQATVITSGVHGVEGFFGSAVQLAYLNQRADNTNRRIVLVHAVNPYGFAKLRRWNEDNVDLNRNFCISDDQYEGASPGYVSLNSLLNPTSPPSRFEPFLLKALWTVARHGMPAVKQAVAGGQYEYPQGLFFGGKHTSASAHIIQKHFREWIGNARQVTHLDLHTGLGKSGCCLLFLLASSSDHSNLEWYERTFANQGIEAADKNATAYDATGTMGGWLTSHLDDIDYRFACAEFGTHSVIRVLAALRAENRAFFYEAAPLPVDHATKQALVECFCPASTAWREQVIRTATQLIAQASDANFS